MTWPVNDHTYLTNLMTLTISDYSWANSLQARNGHVWKGPTVLHLLLQEQQRTGTQTMAGGEGPCDLPQ